MSEVIRCQRRCTSLSLSSIEDLHDDLLIKILARLPCESAHICKCVCKRWFSLISVRKFVIQHLHYNDQIMKDDEENDEQKWPPSTLILERKSNAFTDADDSIKMFRFSSTERVFQFLNGPFLEFLPNRDNMNMKIKYHVVATFKDLILCLGVEKSNFERSYYVCNPLTMQWVALPTSPLLPLRDEVCLVALICEDPYNLEDNNDGDKQLCRFRVVVASNPWRFFVNNMEGLRKYDPFASFSLVVFCSESWQWKEIILVVPTPDHSVIETYGRCRPHPRFQAVVCNGLLCLHYDLKFGAFDPFDVTPSCPRSLRAKLVLPLTHMKLSPSAKLMESGGHLLTMYEHHGSLFLWRLEPKLEKNSIINDRNDNGALIWKQIYAIRTTVQLGSSIDPFSKHRVIGMHPRNHNLMYLLLSNGEWVLLNWQLKCSKILRKRLIHPAWVDTCHRLELQRWPTPLRPTQVLKPTTKQRIKDSNH